MNAPTTPVIRLKDALALLDGPAPVPVRWVTYDRRRGTGGEFRDLAGARIGPGQHAAAEAALRAPTATEETEADRADVAADGQVPVPTGTKDPAHWLNATRNLVDTATGELKKIHIYLLTHVAGRKVYL
ncbi:MAG: hypothetical protein ACRYF0_16645 [Janthinobacterium lividum]